MSRMMHLFRKYQYMLLIVFGVMLMFVFVIGDALTRLTDGGPSGSQADPVVLTWKHGAVRGNELYNQVVRHRLALEFLTEVVQETVRREGTPKGPLVYRSGQFGGFNPGIIVAPTDQGVVQSMVLAAKAESLGIVVNNDSVIAFLTQLSDGMLTENDLSVVYNKTVKGRMTQQHLFDQLQHELLARQTLMLMFKTQRNEFVVTPREAWEYQNRMRRRVQAEMVVLKVDDFKDQVTGTPSDIEIKNLYEEAKDRFASPYSPLPGFARRRKVAFEYVRADIGVIEEEEAAKLKDSITDDDIKKYYEDNKDRYRVIDLPEEDPEATDAEVADPEEQKEEPTSNESTDDASSKPANEPAEEPAKENEAEGRGDESEPTTQAEEPADDSASKPPEPPAPKPPVTATPEVDATDDVAEPAGDANTETTADATAKETTTEEPATEEKPEERSYKPLNDELRDEIRDEIATDRSRQPARERMDKAFDDIKRVIDDHGRELRRIEISESGEALAPLDYETLAAEHGFTAGKIDPSDVIEIEEFDLGQARETFMTAFQAGRMQPLSFVQIAYSENVQPYKATQIASAELEAEFLYWQVGEEKSFVPELADIRDEVVDAWKHQKAFDFAKSAADELAQQATPDAALGDSLSEHKELEIIQPSPFSWMSTGSTPFGGAGAPTLSQVDGVDAAGYEFMKSVFSLAQGGIGVAVDEPKNHVYVVRIAAQVPPAEILKTMFLSSGVTPGVAEIASVEIGNVSRGWYQDLESELQVEWKDVE